MSVSTRTARRSRATLRERRGAVLVPPYDDPLIIAGQGTTGREIVEDLAQLGTAARCCAGQRLRRRTDRRDRARGQGARAGRTDLYRGAGRLRRSCALVPQRPARTECGAQRHDLRRVDGAARPGRITFAINAGAGRRGGQRVAMPRSPPRWRSPSTNSSLWSSRAARSALAALLAGQARCPRTRWWSRCCPAAMSIRNCSTGWSLDPAAFAGATLCQRGSRCAVFSLTSSINVAMAERTFSRRSRTDGTSGSSWASGRGASSIISATAFGACGAATGEGAVGCGCSA